MHDSTAPFRAWLPCEVFEKADADGTKRLRIRGIASTEHRDRDGDTIRQDGLDFSEFIAHGWFNDNHTKDTTGVLGYPDRVYPVVIEDGGRTVKATAVEGYLLDTPEARRIADLAASLKGTPRQLGLSVEGPPPTRDRADPTQIIKAKVRNVAITNCPVNPFTTLGLAKSMFVAERLSKGATTGSIAPLMPESLGGLSNVGSPLAQAKRARELTDEWLKANGGLALSKSVAASIVQKRLPWAGHDEIDRILALARRMGG